MQPQPAMTPERWQRVKAVFVDVVEHQRSVREAVLRDLAERDPGLAEEVRSLLRGSDAASTHFLENAATLLGPAPVEDARDLAGRRVDAYRLVRALGRGGMGTVYEALREEDGKRVAVKLLRGLGNPAQVARRFQAERRILAGLEHDNIARLIDGGVTDEGLPFFTMEYVDGLPIERYCEERALDVPGRLRLFRSVCAAVQYAHQRLVVHRDLKPGNILVTAEGVPKLLDFGIATLVRPEEAGTDSPTLTLLPAMTPEYASPEQVRGEPATTATDVYALGLLLYELLTGRRAQPLRLRAPDEVVHVVCETEPRRPSAAAAPGLRRRLSGDLDAIVLKALRKEPQRRYASAEALSDDVQRHLEGRPVAARRGTLSYRAGKFLRRNWLPVTAATLVSLLTLGFGVATAIQSRRIERERVKAQRVTAFLVDVFKVSDPNEARGNAVTAREVLDAGAARIETELEDQPEVRAALLDTMGRVYENLGLYARAAGFHRRARELRRDLSGGDTPETAASLYELGRALVREGKYAQAESVHREALALRRKLLGDERTEVAASLNDLANAVGDQGRHAEAEALHREALALYRKLLGDEHRESAACLNNLAIDVFQQGRYAEAEALARETLSLRRKLLGDEHLDVATSLNNLAGILQEQGRYDETESLLRDSLALYRKLLGSKHPDVAMSLNNLALYLADGGKDREAETLHREVLALRRELLGDEHPAVATSLDNLAASLAAQARYGEAEGFQRQALALRRKLLGSRHPLVATSLGHLALALAGRGRYVEAAASAREAVAIARQVHPPGHPDVAEAEGALGAALAGLGRFDEATPLLGRARGTIEGHGEKRPPTRAALERIASRYEASGKREAAAKCRALIEGRAARPQRPSPAPPPRPAPTPA